MYNISEAAQELSNYYVWQSTPMPMYEEDFVRIVVQSIKQLYNDRNHPEEYDRTLYTTDDDGNVFYGVEFDIMKEEYIFVLSQIRFMRMIMADVSGDGAVSYTTDALSVTGAKEAYKSVKQEIDDLDRRRIELFHKMMAHEEEG